MVLQAMAIDLDLVEEVEDGEALQQGVKLVRFVPSVCHLGS